MLINSLAEFPGNSLAPGFPKSIAYQTPDDIFFLRELVRNCSKGSIPGKCYWGAQDASWAGGSKSICRVISNMQ